VNPYANPQAYRQASVMTATPAQLVVMLYDGVGRFLRQAEVAFGEGAWAHAHDRLGRAEAIINELLGTLDMDQGLISERLQAIYVFCKRQLVEARIEKQPEKIRTVIRLFADLREAWSQIASGGAQTAPPVPALGVAATA
jgi:flagellar secretion chaperone FliS